MQISRRFLTVLAAASLIAALGVASLTSAATAGTWSQYPQGTFEYQATVQAPINADGTSNWSSKSKGGIPVMFKLSSGIGPAVFESIGSDGFEGYAGGSGTNYANDHAYAAFHPTDLTVNAITNLSTDYTFTLGDCHGGSLRWEIGTSAGALFIYYGEAPNFTDCTTSNQSGVNMIGFSDLRYDTSQVGGTFYDTYAHAMTLIGSLNATYVALIVDSGWQNLPNGDQRATISNTTVNDSVYQWVSGSGSLTATCDLPTATIEVGKTDPVVDGAINESPVQTSLVDTGNTFRVVDCKYQYVLSVPSLDGSGTYNVAIKIGGTTVGTARFDLR